MATNESVEFFLRFLDERFRAFRATLNELLAKLSEGDSKAKVAACNNTIQALDDLKRAMSDGDRPAWINPLNDKLRWYANHSSHDKAGFQLLSAVLNANPHIETQTWAFASSETGSSIDFDAVYQQYYDGSRIPSLFDEILGLLQQIVDSGEIDSLSVINALEQLISTIRKNLHGTYLATRGTWEFSRAFLKNYLLHLLKQTPAIGGLVETLEKTAGELDSEMNTVFTGMVSEISTKVPPKFLGKAEINLPMLEYRPGHRKILGLPSPEANGGVAGEGKVER